MLCFFLAVTFTECIFLRQHHTWKPWRCQMTPVKNKEFFQWQQHFVEVVHTKKSVSLKTAVCTSVRPTGSDRSICSQISLWWFCPFFSRVLLFMFWKLKVFFFLLTCRLVCNIFIWKQIVCGELSLTSLILAQKPYWVLVSVGCLFSHFCDWLFISAGVPKQRVYFRVCVFERVKRKRKWPGKVKNTVIITCGQVFFVRVKHLTVVCVRFIGFLLVISNGNFSVVCILYQGHFTSFLHNSFLWSV